MSRSLIVVRRGFARNHFGRKRDHEGHASCERDESGQDRRFDAWGAWLSSLLSFRVDHESKLRERLL